MKLYKTTYHIYDDFGELLRISLDRPTDNSYTFTQITELYRDSPVEKELIFDTNMLEEALM